MAETFNCPKCGAPLNNEGEDLSNKEAINCPYCGETVIVPPELRSHRRAAPQVIDLTDNSAPSVITISSTPYSVPATPPVAKRRSGNCGTFIAIVIVGAALFFGFGSTSLKNMFAGALNGAIPESATILAPQPTATDAMASAKTQIANALVQVTQAVAQIKTKVPKVTPTAAPSATPTENLAATAAVNNAKIAQQRAWPVVVQEKFTDDHLNWTIGTNNNNLALEEMGIAGGKYTWKFTSKKSMASFSFPTMPDQTDLYVSVDMQMTADNANAEDQAGITFRQTQADSTFYFFAVNPEGTYSLSMYDGSGWDDLIPTTDTDQMKPGQVNHLAVSMEGSQILLVINNTVVNSFEDARLSSGVAGLGLHLPSAGEDATVIFTNFSVRAPKK